jgi:iron complex outermembrane recepter protein
VSLSLAVLAVFAAGTAQGQPQETTAALPAAPQRADTSKPDRIVINQITLSDPRSDVILVRGRRERTWDVPGSAIEVQNPHRRALAGDLQTLDNLANAVPGVWLVNDQDPGTNILSIRGATTDRLQQASVGVVLDGVPLADTEFFTTRLFDTERVEVLKGPQGALFGKNASGGVIAIQSRAPGMISGVSGVVVDAQGRKRDDLPGQVPARGYAQISAGNGNLREIEAARSFALPGDWVGRASGLWGAADGWIRNTTLDRIVDATETQMVRLSADGTAGGFDWQVRGHWLEEDGGAAWASSGNVTGKTGGRLSGEVLTDPIGDYEGRAWRRWTQASVRGQKAVGDTTLGLILARDSYQKRWSEELDYRPGALTFFGFPSFPDGIQPIAQPIDVRATSAQITWSGLEVGQTLTGRMGLFYQATDKDRVDDFGPLLFGSPALSYETSSQQQAVFGELAWTPTQALGFEVQGRYDVDRRRQTIRSSVSRMAIDNRSEDFGRFQPRVSMRFTPDRDVAFYLAYGEAFRPGGFNPIPGASSIWSATYRPEVTTSLEAGLKARGPAMLGGVRVELAAFSNQVKDYQNYTFIDGNSVTLNVDQVKVEGFEATLSGALGPSLQAGLSYALAATEIQRFIATDPLLGSPATRDYTGKAVPNTPRDTGKVWLEWSRSLGQTRGLEVRLDFNHVGRIFYEIDNVLHSPPRWSADASARLNVFSRDNALELTLKVTNLTDERWAISAFGQGMTGLLAGLGPDGPFDTFTINRGRQWSLSLRRPL